MIVFGFVCLGVLQAWLVRRLEARLEIQRMGNYCSMQEYLLGVISRSIAHERELLLERVNQDWEDFQILHAWCEHLEWRAIEFRKDLESLKH